MKTFREVGIRPERVALGRYQAPIDGRTWMDVYRALKAVSPGAKIIQFLPRENRMMFEIGREVS